MNTIVLILLGTVVVATLAFLVLLFKLSLDDADFWLKVISGVLAAFTFLAGAAALVTGTILGSRQAESILRLEKGVADAQKDLAGSRTKQAEAELALLRLQKDIGPRSLDLSAFLRALKDKPKGKARLVYQAGDIESHGFADDLAGALSDAGWEVSRPAPVLSVEEAKGGLGISIITREMGELPAPPDKPTAISALRDALFAGDFTRSLAIGQDATMPDDTILIVVGPKH